MKNLNWAISTVRKCFVAPNMINPSLLKDDFAFSVAITQLSNAIEAGEISKEEVEKQIMQTELM